MDQAKRLNMIEQDQLPAENTTNADTEEEDGSGSAGAELEKEKKKKAAIGRPRGSSGCGSVASPPCCQAERCGADLSNAKRYHRRHKVCEVHSKAPVVLVAGLRQRFCQQCSRFHEISEFDEAKRSCRTRLAGHNERRRKSSVDQSSCYGESSSTSAPKTSKDIQTHYNIKNE